jgi:hypothetical protein
MQAQGLGLRENGKKKPRPGRSVRISGVPNLRSLRENSNYEPIASADFYLA